MAEMNGLFSEKVLALARRIPSGRITTYKEIADAIRRKEGKETKGMIYRAVGMALHNNKNPIVIPCHRVVNSDGIIGGYSEGIENKIKLLRKEGVIIRNNKIVDFEKRLFKFNL